jgi:hypothetical protein
LLQHWLDPTGQREQEQMHAQQHLSTRPRGVSPKPGVGVCKWRCTLNHPHYRGLSVTSTGPHVQQQQHSSRPQADTVFASQEAGWG